MRPTVRSGISIRYAGIKRCHHTCCLPESSPLALRFAAILGDRRFADPLPIWCFVVEHPERLVIIDAGATPDYNDDASWRRDDRGCKFIRSFIRIAVEPSETLPAQLRALGIHPSNVTDIVLTHQHIDHTASVPAFDNATVWTTAAEDAAADRIGAFPWRWRDRTTEVRHIDSLGSLDDREADAVSNSWYELINRGWAVTAPG